MCVIGQTRFIHRLTKIFLVALAMELFLPVNLPARTAPDLTDPLGFFSTVADKLLRSTFSFGVTNIPVYVNGQFGYTPAVNRLLQLAANIYDAGNTNYFPVVFRPCFGRIGNDVFITGYEWVYSSTQPDFPLAQAPMDISDPRVGTVAGINVYGVPWIIGAKKGLPNFNQLALVNEGQFTRKLQVTRDSNNIFPANYVTNQMYMMSIGNSLNLSFWNSYNTNYTHPLTVYASDTLYMTLTNGTCSWSGGTNFVIPAVTINSWTGAQWTASFLPPNTLPKPNSFYNVNWTFTLVPPSVYHFATGQLDPIGSPTAQQWDNLSQLPQFGLLTTNYLQAAILDGTNVIDYVQLSSLVSCGNLNAALADPNYPDSQNEWYQWSTNQPAGLPANSPNYGTRNQIIVSLNPSLANALSGNSWLSPSPAAQAAGFTTPAAESAYFQGFFAPTFQYSGVAYKNFDLTNQVPYTPARTIFTSYLLQANDPLVHYLASDLGALVGTPAIWYNGSWINGWWYRSDNSASQPLPTPPTTPIKAHYQPWGQSAQMAKFSGVDTNGYNLSCKDPIVWGSDYWDFPTNLYATSGWIGRVHRGTPWQTIYLKSTDLLTNNQLIGDTLRNIGTNTWMQWTGDLDPADASLMAPAKDWRLAGLLATLFTTNDATQLFSVNDANSNTWLNLLNGLTVYSNSATLPHPGLASSIDTYVMSSNSSQVGFIARAILQTQNQIRPNSASPGDILATPALSVNSPWLNLTGVNQLSYGISDSTYEAIPAQLLPWLRPYSIGQWLFTNGGWTLQFSGSDALQYEVQTSGDLVNWLSISTNQTVQGIFNLPWTPVLPSGFYRTRLVP